jgi:geranylgeranyl diphosphate synthase type II
MFTIAQLQEKINDILAEQRFDDSPIELYRPISYMISLGGKRLRPVLTLLACDMFSNDIEEAINPAIAIELFHNFTLVHDDIMDNAPIRRNQETVYKKWNTNIAILSGDVMFAKAYQYLIKIKPQHLADVVRIFNNTAIEVCEGQQYDGQRRRRRADRQPTTSRPRSLRYRRACTPVALRQPRRHRHHRRR